MTDSTCAIYETLHELQKKLKAPKTQRNNFGKYNYRHYEDIILALKEIIPLGCSVTLSDKIHQLGDRYYVEATATLSNSQGQSVSATAWAREQQTKKGCDESQVTGGASSYSRKYALNGLFAIDSSEVEHDAEDNRDEPRAEPKAPDYALEQAYTKVVKLISDGKISEAKDLMNQNKGFKSQIWAKLDESYREELSA